ncbi:hypothetical protein HMPREF1531_01852 [Propionibacterium sp. oral taxon 192 str. F0372]|uniref:ABC transporter ATP-binding protein n=1 Tax=Propionibacterium sp. oral taxon 192 TaxID=671222 RepID=UPI000353E6BE|nr:ABC transporter ATP-binding protein [Propionibacterium sp. oral taxon 192]EPH02544.1 hypothetical protein HMPREF1531_01852 [Propionibacterium sp. oral taxon 192 str. F0372]
MTTALTATGLTQLYPGGGGIRDVNLTVADQSVTAVIGPNGAGKTVLFSILVGLVTPQSGTVNFASSNPRVAYCPDVPQFEPWLTAFEVVQTSMAVAQRNAMRCSLPNTSDPVGCALQTCGLDRVMHRRIAGFSRGMLQRLGIAAGLVTDPDVLVLDEPNSALDPIGRADVREVIMEQKRHRCILLSSHLLSEVEKLADHIIVINHGRMVASGTTPSILAKGMKPVWTLRLASPTAIDARRFAATLPDVSLRCTSDTMCTLGFSSFEAAHTQLVPALAELHAPILEVSLRDQDLDVSFARILGEEER